MKILPIKVRVDNYAYLIIDEKTNLSSVVDPFDPRKVFQKIQNLKEEKKQEIKLSGQVLTTHHHFDHAGGNQQLIAELITSGNFSKDSIKVYGGSTKIESLTDLVSNNTKFNLNHDPNSTVTVTCLSTPCHTQDSICYYVEDHDKQNPSRAVFTGDTLFIAGCGRFFEGTPEEMNIALNQTLSKLPEDTITFVGHEYTKSNLKFAQSIEPENQDILSLLKKLENEKDQLKIITTGQFTIAYEKKINPFMRLRHPSVLKATGNLDSDVETMAKLREMKNSFTG